MSGNFNGRWRKWMYALILCGAVRGSSRTRPESAWQIGVKCQIQPGTFRIQTTDAGELTDRWPYNGSQMDGEMVI
jgi:hypothetical protein